jgi:hypothetical protein
VYLITLILAFFLKGEGIIPSPISWERVRVRVGRSDSDE